MNIAEYQSTIYDSPPCWDLVADVYINELGLNVNDYETVDQSVRSIANAFRIALHSADHGFSRVSSPVDYAVVLLGRNDKIGVHHCGIYYNGSVLHATDNGVYYDELSVIRDKYKLVEYWSK